MNRSSLLVVPGLLLWLMGFLWTGCSPKETVGGDNTLEKSAKPADITEVARLWADSIYSIMTLEERLAQMIMPALYASSDAYSLQQLRRYAEDLKVGSILLLKGDAESAAVIADSLEVMRRRVSGSPGYFLAVDAETGLGMRFSDAPMFPWNSHINRIADEDVFFEYGCEVGREAGIIGINMILGPVLDVGRDHLSGIMKQRSLGCDQMRVAELSIAYARGLESCGVASVVKHFPGHGPTTSDSHTQLPRISANADELYAIDLMPFRAAVSNGLSCIMVGHIWAEALDSMERPASFSPVVITNLLRGEMGFNGLVLVDAMGMKGARGFTSVDAIKAGADIIIAPPDTKGELQLLIEAVKAGDIPQERVATTCKRILFYKYLRRVNSTVRTSDKKTEKIKERLHKKAPDILQLLGG